MMKQKGIYTAFLMLILAACTSKRPAGSLEKLQIRRDSLKKVAEQITQQILEIEQQIAALDTVDKRVTLVTTMPVTREKFQHFIEVQGSVEMKENASIYPEMQGEIKAILVTEGAKVNKGDIIMKLDDDMIRSNIQELETALELANDMYEKQKTLWEKKIGSEVQYLQAKNNKESLEKKLQTLRTQLDKFNIRAPFSGIVDQIFPKVGEMATPAMPVARIINMSTPYIKTDISEDYITVIKKGTYAKVYFPSLNKTVETSVKYVGNYINPANRTFEITIELPNNTGQIKPNLLADILIRDYQVDSAVVVPSHIIQEDRQGNEYVYILENNKAKKVVVKTGKTYKHKVEITEGLSGGEILLDKGARSVQDGQEVKVVKA